MKRLVAALLYILIFISCNNYPGENTGSLFSIELQLLNDSPFRLSVIKNNKASVFIFLATDCPLSQNYTLTLNNLNQQFKNDSIIFYGIIPGNDNEQKDVEEYVNKYKISFQMLCDRNLILTHYFQATKTPEVFVVNATEKILYRGTIDNWAIDLGKHRTVITENYLQDALNNIKENSEVQVRETKAVGCFIEKNR